MKRLVAIATVNSDYHTLSTFCILDYNNDQDLWERKETYYYTYWTSYCELLSYYSIAT